MKTAFSYIITCIIIYSYLLLLSSSFAIAQNESGEFKFIPPYYPDGNPEFKDVPSPQVVYMPEIVYPDDPKLQGREGRVLVKVLIDRKGIVRKAEVLKSPDKAFNKYAIRYARQYKFNWAAGWPESLKKRKDVWLALSINFKPE